MCGGRLVMRGGRARLRTRPLATLQNHENGRNTTAPVLRHERCGRAIPTTPRHLLTRNSGLFRVAARFLSRARFEETEEDRYNIVEADSTGTLPGCHTWREGHWSEYASQMNRCGGNVPNLLRSRDLGSPLIGFKVRLPTPHG